MAKKKTSPSKKRAAPTEENDNAHDAKRLRTDSGTFGASLFDSDDSSESVRIAVAVICACNMNRSMAAHKLLLENGYEVTSYGAANAIKLPSSTGKAYEFPFGTPYSKMLSKLKNDPHTEKDYAWLESKNIVAMLQRNIKLKDHPERWQNLSEVKENVVVCFDDRIYDLVVQDIESREADEFRDVHVVSFDVKDDHDSAQVGADLALRFCEMCKSAGSLQAEVPSILSQLEDEGQRFTIQYTLLHV